MDVLLLLLLPALALLIPTAYAGYIGAPYAPTFMAAVRKTFDQLKVGPGDVLVDLGAGDGRIMLEADRRGARTIGYELSPIMWLIVWVRSWGKPNMQVKLRNFYKQTLPADTTLIFLFLMPHHMDEIAAMLQRQSLTKVKYIISYVFPFPPEIMPLTIIREEKCAPVYIYAWEEVAEGLQKQ